jgi:hypothetical protein
MKKKPGSSRLELPAELQSLVEKREQADRRAKGGKATAAGDRLPAERRRKSRRSNDAGGESR